MSTKYKPGVPVPESGIYKVTHAADHEAVHAVTLLAGNIFPRCRVCTRPGFELVQAAMSAEVNDLLKPPPGKRPGSFQRPKRKIIFVVLFFFLIAGLLIIGFATDLASVSWIASAAKSLLHRHTGPWPHEAPERELLTHLFSEMGIAFIVAALLGATFEFFMRRREEKELNEHVRQVEEAALLSLLGYFMPRSLSEQVRRVFDEKIMRSNLELTYTFENAPTDLLNLSKEAGIDGNDLLLVTVKVEYDLVNLGLIKRDHLIHHGFESLLPFAGYNRFLNLTISQGNRVWISWPKGERRWRVSYGPGPHPCIQVLKLRREVEIAPGRELDIEPERDDTYHVVVEHQLVRRRRDLDSWTTWLPADRLDVNVLFNAVPDLDFYLDRTHPDDFLEVTPSTTQEVAAERRWRMPSYPEGRDGKKREVSAAVLPYQGFTLYWFPRGSFPVIEKPKTLSSG